MNAPNLEYSDDPPFKDRDATPEREITLTHSRPNYAQLRADYRHIAAKGLLQKRLNRKQAGEWAHARLDFEDALLELLPKSELGSEHARVTNAIICLHDWLRLFQEIIKQPPPKGLLEIKEALCARRDELNHLYPPKAHQWD